MFSINIELETLPYSNLIQFGERISAFRRKHTEIKFDWYEADDQIKAEDEPEPEEGEEDDRENDPNWYVVTIECPTQADLDFFETHYFGGH